MENLRQTAVDFFVRAAGQRPNSFTAEGAMIAKLCKEGGLSPRVLSDLIKSTPTSYEEITRKAKQAHLARGKGPVELSVETTKSVVDQCYDRAIRYMVFELDDLDTITDVFYPTYHAKTGKPEERDMYVRLAAENLLRQRREMAILD